MRSMRRRISSMPPSSARCRRFSATPWLQTSSKKQDAPTSASSTAKLSSSSVSKASEYSDEAAGDDAEVGASCFFDDVCNHGVAEKRRHLALDGGMEEMRRRIERMEVSLREGGIVPA